MNQTLNIKAYTFNLSQTFQFPLFFFFFPTGAKSIHQSKGALQPLSFASSTLSSLLFQLGFVGFPLYCYPLKMVDFARVQKELQECSRDMEASGIRVSPKSDNLARLTGTIPGPTGTPYEGGSFEIDITLPGSIKHEVGC